MEKHLDTPASYAKNRKAWRKWFEKNHATEKNVWLIIYKKESGFPGVYYPEAAEEALCFGWIGSKADKRDETSRYQAFAKRNLKIHKEHKEILVNFVVHRVLRDLPMLNGISFSRNVRRFAFGGICLPD